MTELEQAEAWATDLMRGPTVPYVRRAPRGVPWEVRQRSTGHSGLALHLYLVGPRRTIYKRIDGAALIAAWKATIAEPVLPEER